MEKNIILEAREIVKEFSIETKSQSLLAKILKEILTKSQKKKIRVIDKVNLDLRKGELLGIIGRNGSGKSTLLKILAGIYYPGEGSIKCKKEPLYLSGWGQGLQQRLSVKDNIFLLGSINGLSQRDIRKKFREIIDFAGLRDFVEAKVEHLSSGMITRLTFSIGIHCLEHKKPELLLLDEVFGAGGDLEFQRKALEKTEALIKTGITIILVTHNLDLIQKYCNRCIWLENGRIKMQGEPEKVVEDYTKSFS
ncbi:ABC transporter ATP-binding protein [Candidatus Pacearchaeota archaeon]|nr:ABC transporter ATP-binding protein [Candidatus Pacearchaeota archaeon]